MPAWEGTAKVMELDAKCVARAVSTLAAEIARDLHHNHGYTLSLIHI